MKRWISRILAVALVVFSAITFAQQPNSVVPAKGATSAKAVPSVATAPDEVYSPRTGGLVPVHLGFSQMTPVQSGNPPAGCRWGGCSACGGSDQHQCLDNDRFCTIICEGGKTSSGCFYDKACSH